MERKFRGIISLVVLIAFVGGILLFVGCEKNEPEEYKIGAILPLTGRAAAIGEMERDALLLAVEEINKGEGTKGRKIKLITEDSKGTAKDGVSAGMKLMDIDGVKFIITSLTSISSALQPETQKRKVFQYIITFDPTLPDKSDYTFRVYPSLKQAAQLMLDHIQAKGFKKVAALYINVPGNAYEIENIIAPNLEKSGVEFARESFNFEDRDVKPQLLKLKSFNPELLILATYYFQGPMIFKGLAELDFNPQVMVDMSYLVELNIPQEQLEGVLITAVEYTLEPSRAEAFRSAFRNKYNKEPDFDAAFIYDAFKILASAIKENGYDVEKVRQHFLQIKQYQGITGNIEMLPNGDSQVAMRLGVFKEGKIVPYEGQ